MASDKTIYRLRNLLRNDRMDIDSLEEAAGRAVNEPVGDPRLFDLGRQNIQNEADMLAQARGEGPEMARQVATGRTRRTLDEISADAREHLGVTQGPEEIEDNIRDMVRNNGEHGYEPVLSRAPNQNVIDNEIRPMMRRRLLQPALHRRYDIESDLIERGTLRPEQRSVGVVTENGATRYELGGGTAPGLGETPVTVRSQNVTGRVLHNLKVNVDDVLDASTDPRSLNPAGRAERMDVIDPTRREFLASLDRAMPGTDTTPGYAQARATHGGLREAQQAIAQGRRIATMRPEAARRAALQNPDGDGPATPFQRRIYQSTMVDNALAKVEARQSGNDFRVNNPAQALDNVQMENRLRAVFSDNPEGAERFIARLRARTQMLQTAQQFRVNSRTAQRGASMLDRLTSLLAHGPTGAASQIAGDVHRYAIAHAAEQENNNLARALFGDINLENEPYLRNLMGRIRDLVRQEQNAGLTAAPSAITAATMRPSEQ
jgi:hypothetical protein